MYIPRDCLALCQTDTDSFSMGLAGKRMWEVVPLTKRQDYLNNYEYWMPAEHCPMHKTLCQRTIMKGGEWSPPLCCKMHHQEQKKTPALFKVEFEGTAIIVLCSKTYLMIGHSENKLACKGVNKKRNWFTKQQFLDVLQSKKTCKGSKFGSRVKSHSMHCYLQEKDALTFFNPKWEVIPDGVTTKPLNV